MTSVFVNCRPLAWIAILISDSYLSLVLLFAAILSDDRAFAAKWPWVTGLFPRRTAALFVVGLLLLSIVSGFASLYVGTEVFSSNKTPGDALGGRAAHNALSRKANRIDAASHACGRSYCLINSADQTGGLLAYPSDPKDGILLGVDRFGGRGLVRYSTRDSRRHRGLASRACVSES